MDSVFFKQIHIAGYAGELAENVISNWLLGLRESNPAILDMFHERDLKPYRDLLPWSGEFAGKYMIGAYYIYKLTLNKKLYLYMQKFIDELITCIAEDGYIGCFQKECHLTGAYSQTPESSGSTWDAWSHYYIMYGLFLWSELYRCGQLMQAVCKIAGCFTSRFYTQSKGSCILDMGSAEMNLAPLHIFVLLYAKTKNKEYLDFALKIMEDVATEEGGNYIFYASNGSEYYQFPNNRWEGLLIIRGIYELGCIQQNETYCKTAEHIFYSIMKNDIHNTGAFSTDEQAIGTPFVNGGIELCGVIAYNAFAADVLKRTKDVSIADLLEQAHYNAILGSFSPTGRWFASNTPMEGLKLSSCQSLVFQSRPGSPELNSSSSMAPQGIGLLSEWMVMKEEDTLYLNYYGGFEGTLEDGTHIKIDGDYESEGNVSAYVSSESIKKVALRIPAWASAAEVMFEGRHYAADAGKYLILEASFNGQRIQINFHTKVRLLKGELECSGKYSVYFGPILYGADVTNNPAIDLNKMPPINMAEMLACRPGRSENGGLFIKLNNGLKLCDFAHLGITGSLYKTWFKIKNKI